MVRHLLTESSEVEFVLDVIFIHFSEEFIAREPTEQEIQDTSSELLIFTSAGERVTQALPPCLWYPPSSHTLPSNQKEFGATFC